MNTQYIAHFFDNNYYFYTIIYHIFKQYPLFKIQIE